MRTPSFEHAFRTASQRPGKGHVSHARACRCRDLPSIPHRRRLQPLRWGGGRPSPRWPIASHPPRDSEGAPGWHVAGGRDGAPHLPVRAAHRRRARKGVARILRRKARRPPGQGLEMESWVRVVRRTAPCMRDASSYLPGCYLVAAAAASGINFFAIAVRALSVVPSSSRVAWSRATTSS